MAEYIDRYKLNEFIEKRGAGLGITVANCCNFKDIVKMIPTEEVVPRSDYEKLENQLDNLSNQYRAGAEFLCNEAKQEVAREILGKLQVKIAEEDDIFEKCASRLVGSDYCNGRSEAIGFVLAFIKELEKKYIGE